MKLSLSSKDGKVDGFIRHLYDTYPRNPMNPDQFAMVFGDGDAQSIAVFDIRRGTRPNTAMVQWVHTYPHRQGVGTRAFGELQAMAAKHGVGLELYPWKHGTVSQANLMKFYRKQGFKPRQKGGKEMAWHPPAVDEASGISYVRDYDPSDEFYDPEDRMPKSSKAPVSMRQRYADRREQEVEDPAPQGHRGVMKYVPSWDAYFYLSGHMQDRDAKPDRRVEKEDVTKAIGGAMERNREMVDGLPHGTKFIIRTRYRRSIPVLKTTAHNGKTLYVIKTVIGPGARLTGREPIIS